MITPRLRVAGEARIQPDVRGRRLHAADSVRNQLLSAVPATTLEVLRPQLEAVELRNHEALHEAGEPIHFVYFPETCAVSIVGSLGNGGAVEFGSVGSEGLIGLPVFLGAAVSPARAIVQLSGRALRMPAAAFRTFAHPPGPLHDALLAYTNAWIAHVMHLAECNISHPVDQRCARWLLLAVDRGHSDGLALTHEYLGLMLSVRRAGVSVAMAALKDAGIVQYRRGRIQLVDRTRLEAAACGCYDVLRG